MLFAIVQVLALLVGLVSAANNPGCQLAAPTQVTLSNVRTAYTSATGNPFGLAYASQPGYVFVTLTNALHGSALGVLDTTTLTPTLIHNITLPPGYSGAADVQLNQDGSHLYIAASVGAIIVSTADAIANSPNAIIGTLNGTTDSQKPGTGSIQVLLSKDESYAFVNQEYGSQPRGIESYNRGNVDVFKLQTCSESVSGNPTGYITLAYAVTGSAISPDGQTLYSTSEAQYANSSPINETGLLHTISVPALEADPFNPSALLSNVSAGCGPVRIIVSKDGSVLWLTARESNHLLAFNSSKLVSNPDNALIASVQVGNSPVGLAFARNETRILTADSNRMNNGNVTGITVVDVQAALRGDGDQAALGRVPTGSFPRDIVVSPDGSTALVADYGDRMVQAIDVSTLP